MVTVVTIFAQVWKFNKFQYESIGVAMDCLKAENFAGAGGRVAVITNLYHQEAINKLSRELHEGFISHEGKIFGYPVMRECIPSGYYALNCHADTYWLFVDGDEWNNDGYFEIKIVGPRGKKEKNVFVEIKLVRPAKFI